MCRIFHKCKVITRKSWDNWFGPFRLAAGWLNSRVHVQIVSNKVLCFVARLLPHAEPMVVVYISGNHGPMPACDFEVASHGQRTTRAALHRDIGRSAKSFQILHRRRAQNIVVRIQSILPSNYSAAEFRRGNTYRRSYMYSSDTTMVTRKCSTKRHSADGTGV